VHLQPVFGLSVGELPITEALAERILSLPFHSLLSPEELGHIVGAIKGSVGRQQR
jgi:dTDP-4-amino-4,6-dideoxygalactose transaminase